MADEWNDNTCLGNFELYSLLGIFWNHSDVHKDGIKVGKSVGDDDSDISFFAGNTPTGFSLAFPTKIAVQGFFSRLVM